LQLPNYQITQLSNSMILSADVGGTKTLIGLFEEHAVRPRAVAVRAYATVEYPDLTAIISAFAAEEGVTGAPVDRACFGVAGPVTGGVATLTNVAWRVDAARVAAAFDIRHVALLNDLQAMAWAVPLLEDSELHPLQTGEAHPSGNMALIAAGTGLGQALLHRVGARLIPSPSEGGHADFAARNEREIALLRDLATRYGRAEVEHVVSGRGLVNIHRVTHTGPCLVVDDEDDPGAPAAISDAALERKCRGCIEALDMFVDAYGAESGNLALRALSTAGLFVGGGIAPKILPALVTGRFMRAFRDKAPLAELLERMPVKVILNPEVGLLGAAVYAAGLD
jgi:glucokinase